MPRKRFFAMSLGKDDAVHEAHMFSLYKRGRLHIPTATELLKHRGVIRKGKALYFNGNVMPPNIYDTLHEKSSQIFSARGVQRRVDERISLLRQIRELGHKVAVADFNGVELVSEKRKNLARKYGRVVKTNLPIEDISDGGQPKIHPNSMWARDSWKKIGKRDRVMYFSQNGIPNRFGEGGMSVDLPNKIILAAKNLEENEHVKRLEAKGYKFVFLNDGYHFVPNMSRLLKIECYLTSCHPDTFVGTIGKILLVNREYFIENRTQLRSAAKAAGLEIVFVPEAEARLYPANFLPLGNNTILMDKDAK